MPLKLLTPNQVKDAKGQEVARSLLRAQEVEAIVKKSNAQLAKSEADFSAMLARQQAQWAKEEEEHHKEVEKRIKEIESLEEKKLNLLIPLDIINDSTDTRFKQGHKFLEELREREANVEEMTELLEDKLSRVSARESDLNKEIKAFNLKKEGVERQEEIVKQSSKRLTSEMESFYALKSKEEKDLEEKKKEFALMEINLNARIEKFARDKTALFELETKLIDERGTLKRAWEELERKQRGISF